MKRSVAAALAGVLLIGLVGAVAFWPRGATPADEMKVRDDFAARDGNPAAPNAALRTPEPGIHRYATSGSEELKLGPLPAETRPYPTSISAPIVDADPGCFTITLHLLEQHSEDTTYCVGEDGSIRLDGHTKRQQIGPMNPTADMACDPDVLVDPERDRAPVACELTLDGGPKQLTAELTGTSTWTRRVTVELGDGTPVDTTEVDLSFEVTGDLTGTWRERVWLAGDDALPVRITRDLDLDGLAAFTEHRDSTLTTLTPER